LKEVHLKAVEMGIDETKVAVIVDAKDDGLEHHKRVCYLIPIIFRDKSLLCNVLWKS
jgi:hypothetical protein